MIARREAEELLLIEEADAWFEYLEATRGQTALRYGEVEPWVAIDPTDSSHVWLASINRIVGITAQPTD